MDKKFNLQQEIRDYVKKFPNVRYVTSSDDPGAMCFYTKGKCSNGSKGCLYGQVLSNLGYKDLLKSIDNSYVPNDVTSMPSIKQVLTKDLEVDLELDGAELNWHETVQAAQDEGNTWADAIEHADDLWKVS